MAVQEVTFINDQYIKSLLNPEVTATKEELFAALDKAENFKGLNHREVAGLLLSEDKEVKERIFSVAKKIKEHIYGERVVIFAPLYISDYCINKCAYCGFNCDNSFSRRKLSMEEVAQEVRLLTKMGHKRIALEAGEDPVNCPIEYVLEAIKTIYTKSEDMEIRRINVNIAATTVENYKKLKDADIGTYILFQETYNKEAYEKMHLKGPKKSYEYHTLAFDRAMEGGIDDVGAGVLFGLYDYRYEVLGLMLHNEHLEERFGVGFHTISVPRLCPADGVSIESFPNLVGDEDFIKLVAIIRLAVPFTGLIVSTRETEDMRRELINVGVSQISAGSSVLVGGYSQREKNISQFKVADERPAQDIIYSLMCQGLIPSFCTACYRQGRTGDRFMSLAKSGNIKNVCLPNALLSLKEYANDYGSQQFMAKARELIEEKINDVENPIIKEKVREGLKSLDEGRRDLYL